jgi:hypothetical protein
MNPEEAKEAFKAGKTVRFKSDRFKGEWRTIQRVEFIDFVVENWKNVEFALDLSFDPRLGGKYIEHKVDYVLKFKK